MDSSTRARRHRLTRAGSGTIALSLLGALVTVQAAPNAQAAAIPTPGVCGPTVLPGNWSVTSTSLTPDAVDVRSSSKKVTIRVNVTGSGSNPADIKAVRATLTSPGVKGVVRKLRASLSLVAGTARTGGWRAQVTVPRWTNNGTWALTELMITDASGTSRPDRSGASEELAVRSTPDVTAPTLTSLRFSKRAVSTKSKSAKVKITARAKDKASGATSVVLVSNASDPQALQYGTVRLHRTGGTRTNAKLAGTLVIPRWRGSGTHAWKMTATVRDARGNERDYSYAQLKKKRFDRSIKVTSTTDVTTPNLTKFGFSPRSIDVRSAAKKVAVTISARDARSGVKEVTVSFESAHGMAYTGTLRRTGGTAQSGTWKGNVTFPTCWPEPGVSKARVWIWDKAGNARNYSPGTLTGKGWPANLTVASVDRVPPELVPVPSVPAAGGVVLRFNEPVILAGPAGSIMSVDYGFVPGTWSCANGAGAIVVCDADGAAVRSISFTPAVPLTPGQTYTVFSTPPYDHSRIHDLSGNELPPLAENVTVG